MSASDIAANRAATKYSTTELARRLLWSVARPLFRLSPRPMFAWRRWMLRALGARIGEHVHVYGSAEIYFPWNLEVGAWSAIGEGAFIYNLGPITIGREVTISQRAHLCAGSHDYRRAHMPLLKPAISIGDRVWICAEAFVGPGLAVGDGAVVAARGVVTRDVAPWTVVAGNPARVISQRIMVVEEEA